MSYIEQWEALSAHIRGLAEAAELHARFLAVNSSDSYGRGRRLAEQCRRIVAALRDFHVQFEQSLPVRASDCLAEFLTNTGQLIEGDPKKHIEAHQLWHGLVLLSSLEAEMSYLLSDRQELLRSRSELAFLHLQRLLVVDDDLRRKWQTAFDKGEVRCEQLGAIHLLWHGIWAFKIDASGARTDLVFAEPLNHAAQRAVLGLVLTEWKVATSDKIGLQFEQARKQADLYQQGPLAGSELAAYRYAVVVSREEADDIPDDIVSGGVTYRHINIAVEPQIPSRRSRKAALAFASGRR